MRQEYALDALVDYGTEPDDPTRGVPNPVWRRLDAELRKAKAEFEALSTRYGYEAILNEENPGHTMGQFMKANATLGRNLEKAARRVMKWQKERDAVPRRVPIRQVAKGEVRKLAAERKHLTTVLKMSAYQVESDLVRLVEPFYARATDEGRTLIQSAFNASADLKVTEKELKVTLSAMSSPHRSKAIHKLCEELNKNPVRFPGTSLTMHFAVAALG